MVFYHAIELRFHTRRPGRSTHPPGSVRRNLGHACAKFGPSRRGVARHFHAHRLRPAPITCIHATVPAPFALYREVPFFVRLFFKSERIRKEVSRGDRVRAREARGIPDRPISRSKAGLQGPNQVHRDLFFFKAGLHVQVP